MSRKASRYELLATFCYPLMAAGLFASILGARLTYAARKNGDMTRSLVENMAKRLEESMERIHRETLEVLEQWTNGRMSGREKSLQRYKRSGGHNLSTARLDKI